ncbi:primase [Glugoides intestinalis]
MTFNVEHGLRIYYKEIFPLELIYKVLEITERREVSFYTATGTYLRYLTFDTVSAFREKLEQVNPWKLDLGPYYDIRPSKCNGATPIARELVFDIDLTDYPRECCQEKKVCVKCYEKIKCAVKILDYALKYEFGFNNYGFVFSGRRGVHCWVLEKKELPAHVRNDIFKYFQSIIEKNIYVKAYDRIMQEFGEGELIKNFFPRIDKQVTVSMTHLIKMPFSIHPETMRLSVPLNPESIPELETIPTLEEVILRPELLKPYCEIFARWEHCK